MSASLRNPGWVYVLDDGPGTRGVLALDTVDGGTVRVVVDGLDGRDTEGLAVAGCADGGRSGATASPDRGQADRRGPACLFIGDIGNNQNLWSSVHVWRVREPRLERRGPTVTVAGERSTLTYPGAPSDAEALLVADGRPFLVTKERRNDQTGRTPRPRLLAAERWGDGTLADLGAIPLPAPRVGLAAAAVGNVVTGGDVTGDVVILRTYDHVVRYTPPSPGAPVDTLPRWSADEIDGMPVLPQPEGVALDRCGLWLVSEGVDSLWLVPNGTSDDDQEQTCPSGNGPS